MKKILCALMLLAFTQVALASNSTTIRLLVDELEFSQDYDLKMSIVKTLRTYNNNSTVQRSLMRVLSDTTQNSLIRGQAAKSLANIADKSIVRNALTRAHDGSLDIQLRAAIIKSLYKAVANDSRIRKVLIQNLRERHDDRILQASAFALMGDVGVGNVQTALERTAANKMVSVNTRIEAIKSLYGVINSSGTRRVLSEIAGDSYDNDQVRVAAIKLMVSFPRSSRTNTFLHTLLTRSNRNSIRSAAATTLKLVLTENDIRWLRVSKDPRTGLSRNPFDSE